MLSIAEFLSLFSRMNYLVNRKESHAPYHLNIVGIRNSFGRVNHFDDTIHIYYEEQARWVHKIYPGTTLPGTPSLLKPSNPKGTAILKPGQYFYKKGLHKGKYEALVQASPVIVYRDNNKNLLYDTDTRTEEAGYFGINIHKASWGAKLVGPDSYGCQVIREGYDSFMNLINKSLNFRKNIFTYTLVEV